MVDILRRHIPSLNQLCERYQIAQLWIFGSSTRPTQFSDESDLDFLYVFDDEGSYKEDFSYAANWSDFLDDLRELFNRDIQLIPYGDFPNPYFKESVEATKVLIYDKYAKELVV